MENKSICCKFKYQDWSTLSTVSVGWDINMLGDLDYHLGDLILDEFVDPTDSGKWPCPAVWQVCSLCYVSW